MDNFESLTRNCEMGNGIHTAFLISKNLRSKREFLHNRGANENFPGFFWHARLLDICVPSP